MGTWNHRAFGSHAQPVHKSQLNQLTGPYGCPKRFWYEQNSLAQPSEEGTPHTAYASTCTGTAVHETIYRALKSNVSRRVILEMNGRIPLEQLQHVYMEELAREIGSRSVDWRGEDPDEVNAERVAMIAGLLAALPKYVATIEMVEGAFIARIEGHWISGHCDLVYRPRGNPHALAFADWKTGGQKPDQITLDHGWEAGFYAAALHDGVFLEREQCTLTQVDGGWRAHCLGREVTHASHFRAYRECIELALRDVTEDPHSRSGRRFGQFPAEIFTVQLADYVPYVKAGTKKLSRPEDVAFYRTMSDTLERPRFTSGGAVKYYADEPRGPAWLPVRVTEHDLPRLATRLRDAIRLVRMGLFVDLITERCKRCPFQQPCLNRGYDLRGAEQLKLREVLRLLPREVLAAAAELGD